MKVKLMLIKDAKPSYPRKQLLTPDGDTASRFLRL
jgi:hypothetical protein